MPFSCLLAYIVMMEFLQSFFVSLYMDLSLPTYIAAVKIFLLIPDFYKFYYNVSCYGFPLTDLFQFRLRFL